METSRMTRGLLSVVLAAALFFCILPEPGWAEEGLFQRITAADQLTCGHYVLVTSDGYAPGVLQEDWVTPGKPGISGDTVTDPAGCLWTLTVDNGSVTLTDSNGTAIAPPGGGENGIAAGDCLWEVSFSDGLFSFHCLSGEEPMTFAANRSADFQFRAYKDSAIAAGPEAYPSAFALYRLAEEPVPPGESEETTAPTEESAATEPPPATEAEPEEVREVVWAAVSLEDILPTDTVAVTMTKDGTTWAISSAGGLDAPPEAVEVTLDESIMRSADSGSISWNLRQDASGLVLSPAGSSDAQLFTYDKNNGVRVGAGGDGYWAVEDGYLKHAATGRYLNVYEGTLWRATTHRKGEAENQVLSFWRLPVPETVANVTMTPAGGELSPGGAVTLGCETEGASLYYALSADGERYGEAALYSGPIAPEAGFGTLYIKAWAVKDGCTGSGETVCVFTEAAAWEWNLYFGQLHAHTDLSDGLGTVEEAFAYADTVAGLDFFAVTDHSNSFDHDEEGAIAADGTAISADWAAGKAAASAATHEGFVGLFGYEMTWPEKQNLGHISTFNTPGWQSRHQEAFSSQPTALENYYQALTTVPDSISQFNHPGTAYGEFEGFTHYSAACDSVIQLLEVGTEGGHTAYNYYTHALDRGWHVAPTNNQNNHNRNWGTESDARTVILAKELTEESLYDAMRNRRVYASEDKDLKILYALNGNSMGSILYGDVEPQITVQLSDPTDEAVGKVEVIVDGGTVAAEAALSASEGTLTIDAPSGYRYYYLRVTQPDGDIAVTAPVWVDDLADMGIASFSSDTEVPAQGEEIQLTLELFNDETLDFSLETLEFYADGQLIHSVSRPGSAAALGSFSYTFSYTHQGMGTTEFRAVALGTVNGQSRSYEKALTLRYRVPELVTRILVDGGHGNAGIDSLHNLTAVAEEANIGVTVFTGSMPENGNLLLVSAPSQAFSEEFLAEVTDFVRSGGSVVLCGQSDAEDGELQSTPELNRLLSAMGSTLRLNGGTAVDPVNNGGRQELLFTTVYNPDSQWCSGLTGENVYQQDSGCTVDPGGGTWLVKGLPTTVSTGADGGDAVLLACEDTAWGGTVFVSGSLFLSDEQMPLPDNSWSIIRANQFFLEKLLDIQRAQWPLSTISDVRGGTPGQVYRIRGYATSGTSHPGNIFADTIYVQDDTGGIAVVPFTESGIEVGTPLEVVGYLSQRQGNPVLEVIGWAALDEPFYRWVPKTSLHDDAMNYEENGGRLMQVEGTVVGLTKTSDGKGITRIRLADRYGKIAEVFIEDTILSGAYGVNHLASEVKLGRTVRAMGILHLDENGDPVLRVRNCDEVVYVPPVENPYTGDGIGLALAAMVTAGAGLMFLPGRKKSGK